MQLSPPPPRVRYRLKLAAFCSATIICLVVGISAQEPDSHTPTSFLLDRKSRLAADYVLAVLGRGDAAELTPGVRTIHAQVRAGQHEANLDVIRVNLTVLISTAESMIRAQDSPDRPAIAEENISAAIQTATSAFEQEASSLPNAQIESGEEYTYVPPEHDQVYNEAKKDLLEEAYAMLETLDARQ